MMPRRVYSALAVSALLSLAACAKVAEQALPTTSASTRAATLVVVDQLQQGEVQSSIERTGQVEALRSVDLFPYFGGTVDRVLVDVGDVVRKGDPLVQLDQDDQSLNERKAANALAEAQAAEQAAEIALADAEERLHTAETQVKQARRDHERNEELFAEQGLISEQVLEQSRLTVVVEEAGQRAAELSHRRAEVERDQAVNRVEGARLAWEEAKLLLSRTVIRAPMDGVVTMRGVDPGANITAANPLLNVVDHHHLVVNLRITQKDLLRIAEKQAVEVTAKEALPGHQFHGAIERISPAIDPISGTVTARVALEADSQGLLRPGLFVECRIITETKDESLLVSRRAVFFEEQKPTFFIVDAEGVAKKVQFVAGSGTQDAYEILSSEGPSLSADTRVVVIGKDRLQDGDQVQTQESLSGNAPAAAQD